MSATSLVKFESDGQVARITITREDRRNALSRETIARLEECFIRAAAERVRAIVLTGAGEKAFCAGADMSDGTGIFSDAPEETSLPLGDLLRRLRHIEVPIVARINGACMAGGVALLSAADLAVAADDVKFGLPEARVGMFPMQVIAVLKPLLRQRDLAELCFCSEPIDAQRALQMGLLNRVVPRSGLDASVDQLVTQVLTGAPNALRRGKYALAAMAYMEFEQALAFAESQVGLLASAAEAREGLAAFNEKRLPSWRRR